MSWGWAVSAFRHVGLQLRCCLGHAQYGATQLTCQWSRAQVSECLMWGLRNTLKFCLCCALVNLDYYLTAMSGVLCTQHSARCSEKKKHDRCSKMMDTLDNQVKTLVKLKAIWGRQGLAGSKCGCRGGRVTAGIWNRQEERCRQGQAFLVPQTSPSGPFGCLDSPVRTLMVTINLVAANTSWAPRSCAEGFTRTFLSSSDLWGSTHTIPTLQTRKLRFTAFLKSACCEMLIPCLSQIRMP